MEAGGDLYVYAFTPNGDIDHILEFISSRYINATDGKVNRALLVNNSVDNLASFGVVSVPKIKEFPRQQRSSLCNNQTAGLSCAETTEFNAFNGARSRHPGGVNTVFADGSVRFIKDSVNYKIWIALGSIAGNEVVSANGY